MVNLAHSSLGVSVFVDDERDVVLHWRISFKTGTQQVMHNLQLDSLPRHEFCLILSTRIAALGIGLTTGTEEGQVSQPL